MSPAKYLIAIVLLAALYFVFFATELPDEIEYRGQTLGPREKVANNSTRNFDIYSYRDKTNHHVLLFVMVKDDSATAQQLLEFYVGNFERQGFDFRADDGRYLGTKDDEVIYMTKAMQIDSAVAYVEKAPSRMPTGFRDASDIFSDLERFSFEGR